MVAAGVAGRAHAWNLAFPAGRTTPWDRGFVSSFRGAASGEQGEGRDEEGEEGLVRRFHDEAINGGGAGVQGRVRRLFRIG